VVDCSVCIGTQCGEHLFLDAEGFCCCNTCGKVTCLECICQKNKGEDVYCYDCYLPSISINSQQVEHTILQTERRAELQKWGVQTTTLDEDDNKNGEIYDAVQGEMMYDEKTTEGVRFPIQKGSYLKLLQRDALITTFYFRDGGQFLIDEYLSSEQKLQILSIMASLVNMYDPTINANQNTLTTRHKTYKILPTSIVGFARACRIDPEGGNRLLERVRHATDTPTK
jgi:hypothetical protein